MEAQLLRMRDIIRITGLSKATIYRQMDAGTFPKSIPLGGRVVGWEAREVQLWIDERIATAKNNSSVA